MTAPEHQQLIGEARAWVALILELRERLVGPDDRPPHEPKSESLIRRLADALEESERWRHPLPERLGDGFVVRSPDAGGSP